MRGTILDTLTPDDIRVLVENEDEHHRRGNFHRLLPHPGPIGDKYLRSVAASKSLLCTCVQMSVAGAHVKEPDVIFALSVFFFKVSQQCYTILFHRYMEKPRYYNLLSHEWATKYHKTHSKGKCETNRIND